MKTDQLKILWVSIVIETVLCGHGSYVMDIDNRFETVREDNPYLVEFYAPWCGHCKQLEPIYEEVAARLDGTGIAVAKIDATYYTDVAAKYEIQGFPTILYIKGDKVVRFRGDRTVEDLTRFAVRCHSPALQRLHSVGGLKDRLRINSADVFFVYVGTEDHDLFADFKAQASNHSITNDFYRATEEAFKEELDNDMKLPTVFVYKDGTKYAFSPMADSSLEFWIDNERYTAITVARGAAFHDLLSMDKILVLLAVDMSRSKRILNAARPVAMDRRWKDVQFVQLESTSIISNVILDQVSPPYAIAMNPVTFVYYDVPESIENMSSEKWKNFLIDIVTGKAEAKGGRSFFRQIRRALYGLATSLVELWMESRFLFFITVVVPLLVVSFIIYLICCLPSAQFEEDGDEDDEDDEDEEEDGDNEQKEKQKKNKADTGHLKSE